MLTAGQILLLYSAGAVMFGLRNVHILREAADTTIAEMNEERNEYGDGYNKFVKVFTGIMALVIWPYLFISMYKR